MGMHWGYGGYMGGWMFIWWILFFVIIGGVFTFFLSRGNNGQKKSALDILKERYARGEFSREEFEKIKKDII